jgi:hypothetical protein
MVPLLAVAVSCIILVFPASAIAQTGPMRQPVIESLGDTGFGEEDVDQIFGAAIP